MLKLTTKLITGVFIIILFTGNICPQVNYQFPLSEKLPGVNPPFILSNPDIKNSFGSSFVKKPGHFTRRDWQQLIDSVWGPGLPTAEKLEIFDKFWKTIDSSFACFHHLSLNWDSIKQVYRPEIAAGVSKGRFSAILTHLALLLRESHTNVYDNEVINTYADHGIPLFLIWGLGTTGFGAGITPLQDSSLLVYNTINSHPLGLQKGDIILGYDRIPWKTLYKELIEWELPLAPVTWIGSSPSSFTHSLLRSAGRNWHLFDTIDIVKFSNGDTVHLPTSLMSGTYNQVFNTEQMDIPGVAKPIDPEVVSYGIVQGTNIGYIYVYGWYNDAEIKFALAVQNLLQTDGMIIDFRFNLGGNMFLSNAGLYLLFDSSYSTIDFGMRCSPNNLEMCPLNIPHVYIIPGAPPGYNKPIAVLTGQGAVSSGDQVALRFKYHKHARFFGKSTSTAFNSPVADSLHPDFTFRHVPYDAYELSNPNEYLTHKEFPVDEEVWLTPAKVAQGRDDVVEAAINWINKSTGISVINSEIPQKFELEQNYPNPFNPATCINYSIPQNSFVTLKVYDVLGHEIATLINENQNRGNYKYMFSTVNYQLSSGIYFYRLETGNFTDTKRMILIK